MSSYTSINTKFYEKSVGFVSSKKGKWLLVLWAFFEASFWFIAPDFLLGIFGLLKPKEKNRFFFTAFLASLVGGVTYYILNRISFETMGAILAQTPFVTERMMAFIRNIYATYGLLGVFIQSFSFMSFKIWTHLAVEFGFNPFGYFVFVMISRCFRFYPVVLLASFVSKRIPNFTRNHFATILVVYTASFLIMLLALE